MLKEFEILDSDDKRVRRAEICAVEDFPGDPDILVMKMEYYKRSTIGPVACLEITIVGEGGMGTIKYSARGEDIPPLIQQPKVLAMLRRAR